MSNAVTSSVALTELKTDLTKLSATLHEIFDLMSADMSQVGQAWQDGKYEEFVQGYRPQINKCEEISLRYSEWCSRVLDPTIENVIAVEKTDVGSGGGSAVGTGMTSAGAMAGAGAAAVGATAGKIGGFNMGGQTQTSQKPSSKVTSDIDAFLNKPSSNTKKSLSEADIRCQEAFGPNYHGIPSTKDDSHVRWGGNTPNNNKITTGLEVDLGILKGKLGSEAGDGTSTPEGWAQCVKD